MTGSLQVKRNRKNYFVVLNMKDETGQRKQKWIDTGVSVEGNNKREANKVFNKVISDYENAKTVPTKEIYFVDWLRDFVKDYKKRVELTTYEAYDSYFRIHFEPYFTAHKLKLAEVTPKDIKDYYNFKLDNGRADGKGGLSANSIKRHSVILRGAFDEAVDNNIIVFNPVDRVKLPQPKEKFIGKFYTAEQANQLLEAVKGDVLEPVVILTLYYGLRRSEVLGLKWDSIDFKNGTVTIKNTITRVKTIIEKNRAKNDYSYRTLPLLDEIKPYLERLRSHQAECEKLMGNGYVKSDYVCRWDDGRKITPNYVSTFFPKLLKRNCLPVVRFHDLRHTCASLLVAMHFSLKEIGEWLGQNNIATTNIYAHLQYDTKITMGERLNGSLKLNMA